MTKSETLNMMKLLGIKEVTTPRQALNGTREFELPIKNNWPGNQKNATFIRVASFKTGYVRNQNSGYSNYQLNKRYEGEPEYFKDYETTWHADGTYTQKWTGKYRAFTTRKCKLIPNEVDRLQYLLNYCIKNYYIRHANFVANGDYIPKWRYDNLEEKRVLQDISVTIDGQRHTLQTQETLKI